jgi:uncharacterized phage-associated protein
MAVANYIINKGYEDKKPVSNLQLQKMLYFAWIDYYKQTKRHIFWDSICAWQFGPVVPEVYYEYCAYGGRPINIRCETEIIETDRKILDDIINQYIDVAVNVLVDKTHKKGSPWDIVYQNGAGNRKVIPFQLIEAIECGG